MQWLHRRQAATLTKSFYLLWQRRMWRRIEASGVRPDVVYLMRPTFALVGLRWARRAGAKIVLRQYGTWIYHHWMVERDWEPRLRSLGECAAMKMPMDLFIMTNDGTMGDRAAELLGVPRSRLRFWINGVDRRAPHTEGEQRAARRRLDLPEMCPVLMVLGRHVGWKRFDRALDAMALVIAARPDARLLVVGDGPLRGDLTRHAERLGIAAAVRFAGAVSNDEVTEYLRACDVFLMPYDLSNLSNTLLEALACGCCIVTHDVGETTRVARHDDNAIVLGRSDPEAFARSVLELLSKPDEVSRLRRGAHAWATANLQTWDERIAMEVAELGRLIDRGA